MKQPDILVFLSDQHTPYFTGYRGGCVDTPSLDALVSQGVSFDNAYTACPLCVPARMSMLSTLMPCKTGVYGNNDTLSNGIPTFLHPLVAAGYETVLAGRMHFVGADQRHGFTRRIAPDMTPVSWTRPVERLKAERGPLVMTYAYFGATKIVGGGESPVIHYDNMVTQAALSYLDRPHDKPQFIVVGTYGPHFPYITTPALFRKYYERVRESDLFRETPAYLNPLLRDRRIDAAPDVARGCAAAYCGLVEQMDTQIGLVREAFLRFCEKRGTDPVFCYVSDHGDQVGDRGMFGKDTFFEKSVKVPMIFAGTGIAKGVRHDAAVSLLDLGPTLLALAGAQPMEESDGVPLSLSGEAPDPDRVVLSEHMEGWMAEKDYRYACMAAQGDWKLITYHGYEAYDALFNVRNDPDELVNRIQVEPERAAFLRGKTRVLGDPAALEARQRSRAVRTQWFRAYEAATGIDDAERWHDNPPSARGQLEVSVTGQGAHP